jgi:hypothetical protein
MKTNFLLPTHYKKIGWIISIPVLIIGFITSLIDYEPSFLYAKIPAIFINEFFGRKQFIGMVENNLLNEICGVLLIVGFILIAFSKEKMEDEYLSKIRLESLVWAVYVNYAILLLAFILVYDLTFFWVMMANIYTVLVFFIIRFNWKVWQLQKTFQHEE